MSRPAGRRPRGSTVVTAVSALLGIGMLLWGADRVARWGAEYFVARHVQAATGVIERPAVEVRGGFVLFQALSGRYEEVAVALDGLTAGPLRIDGVDVELRGVHLTFHDLLVQNPVPLYVEESRERAVLSFEDLNHYLEVTGRPVRIEAAPAGEALLTADVEILGREVSASARALLEAEDGDLAVRPTQLASGTGLDAVSRVLLRERFSFVVPMDPLPFGRELTGIEATDDAVVIDARGRYIVTQP